MREGFLWDTTFSLRASGPLTGDVASRTLLGECSSAVARIGAAMKPTQSGNRVVVIRSTAAANDKAGSRQPAPERATPQRIVVIKDGEWVGGRPGR